MNAKLSQKQLCDIEELPLEFRLLSQKYPNSIACAALDWRTPALTENEPITDIAIYFTDDAEEPDILINHLGELEQYLINIPEPGVICISVNGYWAYIQLDGKIVLDRIGNFPLPAVTALAS